MFADPIADMLTRIRNAQRADLNELVLPYSKLKEAIARVLLAEGYLTAVVKSDTAPLELRLVLKYDSSRKPKIESIKMVSKPGRRVYIGCRQIPKVLNGLGLVVLSTPRGVLSDREARKSKVGGEIICEIY